MIDDTINVSFKEIEKAILKSQHCFRNWDLEKEIPQEHIDLMKFATTQAPSLQNVAFYKIHWIQDRETIEKVHACTHGAPYRIENGKKVVDPNPREDDHLYDMGDATQSQALANIVVVFEKYYHPEEYFKEKRINDTARDFDSQVALGISSGYLNLTAGLLGYETGCCISIQHDKLKEALNMEGDPLLIMGIGIKAPNMSRRVHQLEHDIIYPTNPRQEVPIVEYN